MKLSSIIIAKNEEANIRRCIESQLKCIDEIVLVIDSESSDSTEEIAKEFDKVNIHKTEWKGYSGTKKFALEHVSNDWVLWIDADEEDVLIRSGHFSGLKICRV